MSYLVLARKWRPQTFDEVVGQEHVTRTLVNAIRQDRVAHAFVFSGSRGVGKTSTARILAKALNCEQGPTPTPCNECASCSEITEGRSVDVIEIDGASNRGINEIREVREAVRYAPSRSRYKVYIIDEVHMLTTEAFNALLKTLEEPPAHAIFVFATTEPNKIPVTILSRCQRYDFKRVQVRDIVRRLDEVASSEGIELEQDALTLLARHARGGMRDALSALDQVIAFSDPDADARISAEEAANILGVASRRHLLELGHALVTGDVDTALRVLDRIDSYGHDLAYFSVELLHHLRDMTVVSAVRNGRDITDLSSSEYATVGEHVDGVPTAQLQRMFQVCADAIDPINRSQFPRLLLEMTLVKLAAIEPLVPLEGLLDKLAALENTLAGDQDLPDDVLERYREVLAEMQPKVRPPAAQPVAPRSPADAETRRAATATDESPKEGEATPLAAAPDAQKPKPSNDTTSPATDASSSDIDDANEPPSDDSQARDSASEEPSASEDRAPSASDAVEAGTTDPSPSQSGDEEESAPGGDSSRSATSNPAVVEEAYASRHAAPTAGAPPEHADATTPSNVRAEAPAASAGDESADGAGNGETDAPSTPEAPRLDESAPDADEKMAAWREIVSELGARASGIASHALVTRMNGDVLELWLPRQYRSLLEPVDREQLAKAAAKHLRDDDATGLEVRILDGEQPLTALPSISALAAAKRRDALEATRRKIQEDPALMAAMQQFDVTPDRVSIDVDIDEEYGI